MVVPQDKESHACLQILQKSTESSVGRIISFACTAYIRTRSLELLRRKLLQFCYWGLLVMKVQRSVQWLFHAMMQTLGVPYRYYEGKKPPSRLRQSTQGRQKIDPPIPSIANKRFKFRRRFRLQLAFRVSLLATCVPSFSQRKAIEITSNCWWQMKPRKMRITLRQSGKWT